MPPVPRRAPPGCPGSGAGWWSTGEGAIPLWRPSSTRGALPTRSSWPRRPCATGCGPSSCRARICRSPPTVSISTRPSATCGASPWPGSPTGRTVTNSSPPPTTDRAIWTSSTTWGRRGRPRRRHRWWRAPPSRRRSAVPAPTTGAPYRPSPPAAMSWGRRGWGPTPPPRWWIAQGRMHGLPNVVVADSSVFVTSAGYGPTLTLVALAARAAASLAR